MISRQLTKPQLQSQLQNSQQRNSVEQLQAAGIQRLKRTLVDNDEELSILKKLVATNARPSCLCESTVPAAPR